MERRMLINALHPEEIRIAIVEDGNLSELEIESTAHKELRGNVFKARISRIEPSLQAAFLDIGTRRNGFLQINDVHPAYFRGGRGRESRGYRTRIQDVLEPGQELVVQVVKEEREMKGATLTTYLSLPGRYVVLMPGSERGGISRKISDAEQRRRLKKLSQELEIPSGIGLIVRTAGLDRSLSELARDLSLQLKLWERIVTDAQTASCPSVLYQESDLARRVLRDYFTPEIREIVIDEPETFNHVRNFVDQVMPRYRSRISLYRDPQPIFSYYRIDEQVGHTFEKEVKLKSGGAIVLDSLEALVAIDVNSGKATSGGSIEDTAYQTNLEAADEIARQLRLRDLGGLVVIDFIDMTDRRHKIAVERRLRDAIRNDKARIELGRLSKFGLLELSRQRLRSSLTSQSHQTCAACRGAGKIRAPELVALEVLRKIQSAIIVGKVSLVKARLAPAPALFLLNNKKSSLYELEKNWKVKIFILADGRLRMDEFEFEFESARSGIAEPAAQPPLPVPAAAREAAQAESENEDEQPEAGDSDPAAHSHPRAGARLYRSRRRLSKFRRDRANRHERTGAAQTAEDQKPPEPERED